MLAMHNGVRSMLQTKKARHISHIGSGSPKDTLTEAAHLVHVQLRRQHPGELLVQEVSAIQSVMALKLISWTLSSS